MATGEFNGNGDQRVTNAMLLYRMNEMERLLKQWHDDDCRQHEDLSKRVTHIEQGAAVRESRLAQVEKTNEAQDQSIESLKSSDRKWGGLAVVISAAIAGIGAFFGGK